MNEEKEFFSLVANGEIIDYLASAVLPIVDETSIKISKDNLVVCDVNTAKSVMLNLTFGKEMFKSYSVDRDLTVTINANDLKKALKSLEKGDLVRLASKGMGLSIAITGKYKRSHTIPLVSPEREIRNPIGVPYTCKAKITSSHFKSGIGEIMLFGSESVTMDMLKDKLILRTTGTEKSIVWFEKDSDTVVSLVTQDNQKSMYSLSYLNDILQACSSISDVVTIEFGTNIPLHILFEIPNGKIEYFIAPIIENP